MAAKRTTPNKIASFISFVFLFSFAQRNFVIPYVDCPKFNLRLASLLTDYHNLTWNKNSAANVYERRKSERRLFTSLIVNVIPLVSVGAQIREMEWREVKLSRCQRCVAVKCKHYLTFDRYRVGQSAPCFLSALPSTPSSSKAIFSANTPGD